jgi:2-phospho-L-lactate/phosphoenolpyruvate guanylyltransferase
VRNGAWAVVPLKSPAAAKSRLSGALDAAARQRLMFSMAQHVVRTLAQTPAIAGVAVVTAAPEIAVRFKREGAVVIPQHHDAGTASACRLAAEMLARTADILLMVSGDIPLIRADEVVKLVELGQHAPMVAVVPDRRRLGTNALLCAPPAVIEPCFGPDSFRRHVAAAKVEGADVRVVESDALGLDIDDLDDLDELHRRLDADPSLLPSELREALPRAVRVPAS